MGAKATWKWLILLAAMLGIGGFSRDLRSDVLVTKSGKRWVGTVTDEGDAYSLKRPKGNSLRFPKSMVKEVITGESLRRQYRAMLQSADFTDDAQVSTLAKHADATGLPDEKRQMLLSAGRLRWSKAQDSAEALRRLSKWCREYALHKQASACEKRANRLEFEEKWASARADPARLEELAAWCKAREMPDEVRKCLIARFEERKAQAKTPQAMWHLAEWCDKWDVPEWRDKQRLAAIQSAESVRDTVALERFVKYLQSKEPLSKSLPACYRAIYSIRRIAADGMSDKKAKALTLAELWGWCRQRSLSAEAKSCTRDALAAAPDDLEVREKLAYTKDAVSGEWIQFENVLGTYLRAERTKSVMEQKLGSFPLKFLRSAAPAGKQYVILHFRPPGTTIRAYQSKDYAVVDSTGQPYLPEGLSSDGGKSFMPIISVKSVTAEPKLETAIYFEIPDRAGSLMLEYKGKRALNLEK